jgi:predicted ATP-grasp superfamily ATP-dependent carboligase
MNILLTDITSYKAVAFAQSLSRMHEVRLHTCDHRPYARWVRTKYSELFHLVPSPSERPQEYLATIEQIQRSSRIEVIVPTNSEEIRLLLAHRHRFGEALASIGRLDMFTILDNKRALQRLAETVKASTPRSYASIDDVSVYPVMLKLEESSSSKGVFAANSRSDADRILRERFPSTLPVIQEYIRGEGCGLSVFAVEGAVTAYCGHRRIAEFPARGGSSTIRAPFFHPDMLDIAKRLIRATDWTGFAMFEFKHTEENEIVLIECNPRIWGSIQQSIRCGVDFPRIAIEYMRDRTISDPPVRPDREAYTCLSPLHVLSLLSYLRARTWKPWREYCHFWWRLQPDVSWWRDPAGYVSLLARAL